MKKITNIIAAVLLSAITIHAQEGASNSQLNINTLAYRVQADGLTGLDKNGWQDAITYYTGKVPVVYMDGLVWGGLVRDGQEPLIRVGGNTYSGTGTAGPILPDGTPGPATGVYRIRRDFATADLRRDAAQILGKSQAEVSEADMEQIRSRYKQDWQNWPTGLGAPFYDADGDGLYTPQFENDGAPLLYPRADEPGYANADQVVWLVYNDADSAQTMNFAGSPPIGIETQVTLWAYKTPALENVIYKRWRLLYKGTPSSSAQAQIDSMHLCTWSDTDFGDWSDDLLGFDLERNLAYTYNSNNYDDKFQEIGLAPPAMGYDLIAGPIVKTGDLQDIALFDFMRIPGSKNLSFSSFWGKGTSIGDSDPTQGSYYNGTLQWFNVLLGFRPRPEIPREPRVDPETGLPVRFQETGDPVSNAGWLDAYPGDRRIFPSTGPFKMAIGDTQDVVVSIVLGQGDDRLHSIIKMRENDDIAQAAFDQNAFQAIPDAKVETQIHTNAATLKITATADSLSTRSIKAELVDATGRVYFEETSAQPHRLDVELQNVAQIEQGLFLNVHVTENSGKEFFWPNVQGHITTSGPLQVSSVEIFDDNINADSTANPGEFIYFGIVLHNPSVFNKSNVTCSVQTGPVKRYYEEEKYLFSFIGGQSSAKMQFNRQDSGTFFSYQIPDSIKPGQVVKLPVQITDENNNFWSDTLKINIEAVQEPLQEMLAEHISGQADGAWGIRLADHSQLKNHEYSIAYSADDWSQRLTLTDLNDVSIILNNHIPPLFHTLNMPVTDGFRITLGTLILDSYTRDWSYSDESNRWFASRAGDVFFREGDTYPGADAWTTAGSSIAPQDHKNIEIRFVEKTGYTDLNGNNQYDIGEPYSMPEEGTQKGWFYVAGNSPPETYEGFFDLPFTVWDISADPPRQLAVVLNDWDKNLQWDLRKVYQSDDPDFVDINDGQIAGNFLFILDMEYDPSGTTFDASTTRKFFGIKRQIARPILWTVYLTVREGYEQLSSPGTLQLFKNTPPSSEDVYTFNPYQLFVGVEESPLPEKFSLQQNYPNPFNPETTIAFSLPQPEHVKLRIYNILGQEIAVLIDQKMAAGEHTKTWKGLDKTKNRVASGVYFYKLTAGKFEAVKKMAVVR